MRGATDVNQTPVPQPIVEALSDLRHDRLRGALARLIGIARGEVEDSAFTPEQARAELEQARLAIVTALRE
jgi:hypothetical protein